MKITKGKIVLALIIAYFVIFAVINVNKEKDMNEEILKTVTYVSDGKINKDNEHKLVLVTGKIDYDELVGFDELKDFGTIKISRKVEDYKKVEDDDYEWVERTESIETDDDNFINKLVSEEKQSDDIKIGEFKLDEKGLKLIPANKYYSKQESIGELTTTGISYSRDPWEEDIKVGDVRLTYKYYDLTKNPYITVLAMQSGDTFKQYKIDEKTEVYQLYVGKIDNKDKLQKKLKSNVKSTIRGKTLFILMILGIGIFLIVDNKQK